MSYLNEILVGGWSLVEGMKVTFRRLFHPLVTVQYPRKRLEMTTSYRGHIELKTFEETGTHKCISCGTCEKMCPSGVITVKGEKVVGGKGKAAVYWEIDFSKCSLCGICVESCPTETLQYSKEYQIVGETRTDCVFDLIARLTNGAQTSREPVVEPKGKGAEASA